MKLLLADDEKELSKALVVILKHNNYTVDVVYDGAEALDYIMNSKYDGIILDIMMPKMDGISVLKAVRAAGIMTPVILLTAKSEVDDRVEGLDAGADDYLTKPFSAKELLARIRAMTRRREEMVIHELIFGDIVLDPGNGELKCGQNSIRLANKEFQMLEMMMMNKNKMISAENFMDKIWGFESNSDLNVICVNISYLRKKLAEIGSGVTIKSVRGAGYFLEEKSQK